MCSVEDSLCSILLALASKEVYIKDDLHGHKNVTYSDITDDRILSNGFKARWRKGMDLTLRQHSLNILF
jgi:hypothetical protein